MRIKFLGTGASEGIPSLFCDCRICRNARAVGGKEIRARTGVVIDGKLMIDFPPDIFSAALRFGVDCLKIEHLLITHSHTDHFNADDLVARNAFNAMGGGLRKLEVYSNERVIEKLQEKSEAYQSEDTFDFHELPLLESVQIGEYETVAFRSEHMQSEKNLVFLLKKAGKVYLHLVDSSPNLDSVKAYLQKNGLKADAVVLDTTFGLLEEDYYGHMNFKQVVKLCDGFKKVGVLTEDVQIYLTHIAHCGNATHEELQEKAKQYGIRVAYDGLEIEI